MLVVPKEFGRENMDPLLVLFSERVNTKATVLPRFSTSG